jgi:hypothetical protein
MRTTQSLVKLTLSALVLVFLSGCGGGGGSSSSNGKDDGTGTGEGTSSWTSGSCKDISYEGVKKTSNFPLYDLPTNTFPQEQVFAYYPLSNIDEYENILTDNGFTLLGLNDTRHSYIHNTGIDIRVDMFKHSSGKFDVNIEYKSNDSLLIAVTPAGVPLTQYQLLEHYVGDRNFVINYIAQYISDLESLGFKLGTFSDGTGELWEKQVGNCAYAWFYEHNDNPSYAPANSGYINYNWVVSEKSFWDLEE